MATVGWFSDAAMAIEVEGVMKQGPLTAEHWAKFVKRCNTRAYWTIVGALADRGFTKAQVDAWDRGEEFQRDLGCFFALANAGAADPESFNPKLMEVLDRRAELAEVAVTEDGEVVDPSADDEFGCGAYDTSSDIWVHPDPDDSSLGDVTEW